MPDDDTIQSEETADTLEADAAGAVDDAAETAAGEEAAPAKPGDPFKQFDGESAPAPTEEARTETRRPARSAAPAITDDADEDLVAIEREAAELDESIGGGGKLTGIVKRLADRDRAKASQVKALTRNVSAATDAAAWSKFEETSGYADAPAEVRKALPRAEMSKRFKKHLQAAIDDGASPEFANGQATAALKYEVREIVRQHASKQRGRPGKVVTTETGSRLSPPGGGGGRATKEKLTPDAQFDKGDWAYPAVASQ